MTETSPWQPRGTVYGTLLNFERERALWATRMVQAPYQAAPRAPVLYVKTANTFGAAGAAVPAAGPVWIGATLGLIAGAPGQGPLPGIAGCVLLDDLSLPHESYYRPPIRFRNRDGFLVCGTPVTAPTPERLAALTLELRVNDALVQTIALSTLVRDAATVLADVAEFMTLQPGDVLMLGTDCLDDGSRPLAKAGDRIEISAPGFAPLVHTVVAESSAAGPPQGARAPSGGSASAPAPSMGARSS